MEASLAPDCADGLLPVLAVFVDEEAFTPLVLEPNKASVLSCTVELFLHESQTLNLLLRLITRLWSHLILARGCMEEIPDSRLLILLLQKI